LAYLNCKTGLLDSKRVISLLVDKIFVLNDKEGRRKRQKLRKTRSADLLEEKVRGALEC